MNLALEKALQAGDAEKQVSDATVKRCQDRARRMLAKLTPKQRHMVLDSSPHISALCPRRAGKTYAGAMAALITGEANPGSISLVISLNLKQLRRLYWAGGPSGLHRLAREFGLNLTYNSNGLRWEHENGSIGYLLGCEDEDQLEVIRGLEADLYLVDECKSFAPGRLLKLIDDIIDPQRSSRDGRIILIGTPGFIRSGPFFQATCPDAFDKVEVDGKIEKRRYLVPFGSKDPWGRDVVEDVLWSFHSWTLEENTAKPNQWRDALRKARSKRWEIKGVLPDQWTHPTWIREYLGRWTFGGGGLVFRYSAAKLLGKCTWHGGELPREGAPWRFIGGLDFGYEAPTALVVCAYSRKLGQFRLVYEEGHRHMLIDDIAEMLDRAQARFGLIERIYCDAGNLGVTFVKELLQRGFPVEKIQKREKQDYVELLNACFESGEALVVEGTKTEEQLLTVAWELGDEDEDEIAELARLGKLEEDVNIPNDYSDAYLYCFRGSYHRFRIADARPALEPGTREWVKEWEKRELAKARREAQQEGQRKDKQLYKQCPGFIRKALKGQWTIPDKRLRFPKAS